MKYSERKTYITISYNYTDSTFMLISTRPSMSSSVERRDLLGQNTHKPEEAESGSVRAPRPRSSPGGRGRRVKQRAGNRPCQHGHAKTGVSIRKSRKKGSNKIY